MIVKIEKGVGRGIVTAPSSKSMAHRMLISAAMCRGKTRIEGLYPCEDILATIDCLRALGARIEYNGETALVEGIDPTKAKPNGPLKCRESGSTLRLLIPIAMLSGNRVVFEGSRRLFERPLTVYERIAKEYGLTLEIGEGCAVVQGPLCAGEYFIDGSISSQFISGLLLAMSTLSGDSRIIVNRKIESRPYVDMTIAVMQTMGVRVYEEDDWSFFIFGGQSFKESCVRVEGDWSNAAFLDALNLLGGEVTVEGLCDESRQGDKIYRELFKKLGPQGEEIDISNCPDLGPILFSMAAALGGGRFVGTRRLRDKESDRIASMETELKKFGTEMIVGENSVEIKRTSLHTPTESLQGHGDHRIVMSLAVLCTMLGGEIEGCRAVTKSYPDFFRHLNQLGINAYEIN